ncbi:MAG: hypothetical protein K8R54_08380 [Bacteroidales bacterium]|nr:hypothetical protein [Bacteroidales bacterium]
MSNLICRTQTRLTAWSGRTDCDTLRQNTLDLTIMNKTVSYRKPLSIFMMIVFFSPLLVKATHFLYVHHEHHHISFSDKPEINGKHKKCPICAYEFVEFIDNENPQNTGKPEFFSDYYTFQRQSACIILSFHSFNPRGPPVNN